MPSLRWYPVYLICLFLDSSCCLALPWRRTSTARTASSSSVDETPSPASPSHKRRGTPISASPLPEELYKVYKAVQGEYSQQTFSRNDWRVLNRRDGVEVSMLECEDDPTCPYVRMRATLPVPVEDCWNFLLVEEWERTMPTMDPFFEGVEVYGHCRHQGAEMVLCRKRTKRILAFGKRDLVFLSVGDQPLADGTWVSGSVSVVTSKVPRQKGYTRAFQDSVAFYRPVNHLRHTDLTIVCRIDLNDSSEDGSGGFIPMWLYKKTIGLTGATSVIAMRKALLEEQARRKTIEQAEMDARDQKDVPWWRRKVDRGLLPK